MTAPAGINPIAFFGGDAARQRAQSRAEKEVSEGNRAEVWTVEEYERTYGEEMGTDPLAEFGVRTSHLVVIFE